MAKKEARARIKINKLLENSGWRFEDDRNGNSNIELEPGVNIHEVGEDFENLSKGYLDYLLLDFDKNPLAVIEAKREGVEPLTAKERARTYARSIGARFIILTNGNIHYFWDTKHGNPEIITKFPTPESISQYKTYFPNPKDLISVAVDENYIIQSQDPNYYKDPEYIDLETREEYLRKNHLARLRYYQVQAIKNLQTAVSENKNRFLFEMATGTGKTLVSAGVIKLFLQSGNAKRILFLVDRLELESQAYKAFNLCLGKDFTCTIYKENKENWRSSQIVVSTIQTLLAGDRYKKEFSPTDFEFVISDEAHRSIGGNTRVVFEYFVGYKLGLTATPKDYLKGYLTDPNDSQREFERRQLLDTYKTFGCDAGEPTFRYDLLTGVKDGFLINPILIDTRTEITTQLLSNEGYAIHTSLNDGTNADKIFTERHYERQFFNDETNLAMCKVFIDNGLLDPVAQKLGIELFGKSIIFCVSQSHAARVANILNMFAMQRWPEMYGESDFAVQVSSLVHEAQQMTINFANNNLNGKVSSPEGYESSKTRVCVTVGMMTTGYDCEDLLNVALMRPLFSPSDFVQIKGRGTRRHTFEYTDYQTDKITKVTKEHYKFFDYFATCEYFEKEFKYDQKINLPRISKVRSSDIKKPISEHELNYVDEKGRAIFSGPINIQQPDKILELKEVHIGSEGMRIDREGFRRAIEEDLTGNKKLSTLWNNGEVQEAENYTKLNILNRPSHFLSLEKVKKLFNLDRRVSVGELLQYAFGQRDRFEMKDELLESEWEKFMQINKVDQEHYNAAKLLFKAYITHEDIRHIIDMKQYAQLHHSPVISFNEFMECNGYKDLIPQYVKDYVSLNTFIS